MVEPERSASSLLSVTSVCTFVGPEKRVGQRRTERQEVGGSGSRPRRWQTAMVSGLGATVVVGVKQQTMAHLCCGVKWGPSGQQGSSGV